MRAPIPETPITAANRGSVILTSPTLRLACVGLSLPLQRGLSGGPVRCHRLLAPDPPLSREHGQRERSYGQEKHDGCHSKEQGHERDGASVGAPLQQRPILCKQHGCVTATICSWQADALDLYWCSRWPRVRHACSVATCTSRATVSALVRTLGTPLLSFPGRGGVGLDQPEEPPCRSTHCHLSRAVVHAIGTLESCHRLGRRGQGPPAARCRPLSYAIEQCTRHESGHAEVCKQQAQDGEPAAARGAKE